MTQTPSPLERDIRWLVKHAALVGFLLAILCHLVPHQYRVLCDKVAHLCKLGE